ncbi:MAG: tetraacyldisaccharide 4'-kinase [Candidatus Muiribacteriaceae bacterium]
MKRELIFTHNRILRSVFVILSVIYLLLNRTKYFFYQIAFRRTYSSMFIISVGNITAGGTGKTPVTIEIARMYKERGLKVCVVFRAYRSEKKYGCVYDGSKFLMNVSEAGDEPCLIAEKTQVPVYIGKKRVKILDRIRHELSPDVVILDDAFQYYRLERDADIVCIDGYEMFYNEKLLPAGILREPLTALERADLFIIKRHPEREEGDFQLRRLEKIAPVFTMNYRFSGDNQMSGRYLAVSGIAKPEHFITMLREKYPGAEFFPVEFEDHHNYDKDDADYILRVSRENRCTGIICTEKDHRKLSVFLPDILCMKLQPEIDNKKRLERFLYEMYNRWRSERDRA